MPLKEDARPIRVIRRQSPSWLTFFGITSQRANCLEILFELGKDCCEWDAVSLGLDPILFPLLLVRDMRQCGATNEHPCSQHCLPFIYLEGQIGGNLIEVSDIFMRLLTSLPRR